MRSFLLMSTAIVVVVSGSAQAQPLRSSDTVTVIGMRETAQAVEPATMEVLGTYVSADTLMGMAREIHRSLTIGTLGRWLAGLI